MSQSQTTHNTINSPLAASLHQLSALHASFDARTGSQHGDGWISAPTLMQPESPYLIRLLEQAGVVYGTPDRQIWASFFMNSYAWLVASVSLGCYLAAERVPDLTPANVSLRFNQDAGYAAGISFANSRFWALPDDIAAGHPDATIMPDRAALRDTLRRQIETHMRDLIPALRAQASFGTRALWITVADRCAGFLFWLHQQRPDAIPRDQLVRETDALIHVPESPFNNPLTAIHTPDGCGDDPLTLQRGACCLNYKRPDGNYCESCPITRAAAPQAGS